MQINQANLQGLNVTYSTLFNKSMENTATHRHLVATTVPSGSGKQDYKWLGSMPGMRKWIGEREIQNLASHGYTIENESFEMTVNVPRNDIEDDQYGVYAPLMSAMGESAAMYPDELVYGMLPLGFKEKCYDGKAFFAEDHEVGELKFSNMTKEKLSHESYQRGRTSVMSVTNERGRGLGLVPDLLVVSPANESMGRQILEADLINGTSNINKGTAKLHVEPLLAGHPNGWYLLTTNRFIKPLIYQEREKTKFASLTKDTDPNVFMRKEFIYGADGRGNAGFGLWQMAYGSTGEVAAQG